MKIVADCICNQPETAIFYVSSNNKFGKAVIDVTKESKVAITKKKLQFSENSDTKASAMAYIKDLD